MQGWNQISGRSRLLFAVDCLLKGSGQVFFSSSPLSGLVLLAALFLISWQVGVSALVGLTSATATAWLLAQSPYWLRLGLYGFNGLLVGWVWGYLWPHSPDLFLLNPIVSASSTLLMIAISRYGRKWDLPALSYPFVIAIWISLSLIYALGVLPFSSAIAPVIADHPATGGEWRSSFDYLMPVLGGVALIWVGIFFFSRMAAWMSLVGLGAGLAISLLLGGPLGVYWLGLYAFTAPPLAMACGGLFFRWNRNTVFCLPFALGVGTILWWGLSILLSPLGLYPLTMPFNLTLWLLILLPRVSPFLGRKLGVKPIPLAFVSRPENTSLLPEAEETGSKEDRMAQTASKIIRSSKAMVVLVGAGLSTESGIPDYRSPGGYWAAFNPEDFHFDRILADPATRARYWQASSKIYELIRFAQPNTGHRALVEFERQGLLLGIITQNVDGLHHKAGNSPDKILEIHGSEHIVSCLYCQAKFARWEPGPWASPGQEAPLCPHCHGFLKPDSVLFGQPIPQEKLNQALSWIARADLMLVIGSSLLVQPAASFPARAKEMGAKVMMINLSPTAEDDEADLCLRGAAGSILTKIGRELKKTVGLDFHPLTRPDFQRICEVVDSWFGAPASFLVHPVYVEHFSATSFVAKKDGRLLGFILGFISQDHPEVAYVHLIVTDPSVHGQGIGRALYRCFFEAALQRGCLMVNAITVPYSQGSISFHQRLGFSLRPEGAIWENGLPVIKDYAGPGIGCLIFERSLADPFPE